MTFLDDTLRTLHALRSYHEHLYGDETQRLARILKPLQDRMDQMAHTLDEVVTEVGDVKTLAGRLANDVRTLLEQAQNGIDTQAQAKIDTAFAGLADIATQLDAVATSAETPPATTPPATGATDPAAVGPT